MKKNTIYILLFTCFCLCFQNLKAQKYIITTIAGTGVAGYNGDSIPATSAQLNYPQFVKVDDSGNVYIDDNFNQRIRKITYATGIISTIAGTGFFGYNGDGMPATSAQLYRPDGIIFDNSHNLYITDGYNYRIRKITYATGIISTIAGNGISAHTGDGGLAINAEVGNGRGLAFDSSGNLYFAETQFDCIRKIDTTTGIITTIAGIPGSGGYSGDGGLATSAQLSNPLDIAIDVNGNIYIADANNNRIRRIDHSTGIITTVAGTGVGGYNGDGIQATSAELNDPSCVAFDNSSNMYIADLYNQRIRKVNTATGIITTIAGTGLAGYNGDGIPATSAELNMPRYLFIDSSGVIYIADRANERVRKLIPQNLKIINVGEDLFLPNVITPDGDGINDYLKFKGLKGKNEISIYNRWGTLLYQSDNYQNDWGGFTKGGKKVSDGTYYYILTTSEGKTYTVFLTVLH